MRSEMELGSVADWVSGIGSLGAIFTVWWQIQKEKAVRINNEYKKNFKMLELKIFETESFIRNQIYKISSERSIPKKQFLCNEIIFNVNSMIFTINILIVDLGIEDYTLQDNLFESFKRLNEKNIKLNEINNDTYDEEMIFRILSSINLHLATIKTFIADYHMRRNQ